MWRDKAHCDSRYRVVFIAISIVLKNSVRAGSVRMRFRHVENTQKPRMSVRVKTSDYPRNNNNRQRGPFLQSVVLQNDLLNAPSGAGYRRNGRIAHVKHKCRLP
jgi:hypothetical protein